MMNPTLKAFLTAKDYHTRRQSFKFLRNAVITKFWYARFLKKNGKSNVIMPAFCLSLENIILHNNVLIFDNARIEAIRVYEGVKFDPLIILHDYVHIQQNLHMTCATKIEIGSNTAIAANVTITDIEHPYEDITIPIERQAIRSKPVYIGESCNVSNNAVILPGTQIGKHCTIGANSVVSGIFPDYCVIVGSPARIVKRYSFESGTWVKTDKVSSE